MRKIYIILSILIFTLTFTTSGQEIKTSEKFPWSLSLSWTPKDGFDLFDYFPPHYINETYFLSLDLRVDHRLSKKVSYSFGVNFSTNEKIVYNLIFDGRNSEYYSFRYLFEFPVQVNYHLIDVPKKIDPYLKLAIRNSYYRLNASGVIGLEPYARSSSDYLLLTDLGIGSNFKLNDKFSIIFESSIGYGLIYWRSNHGYLEGLIGLRYTFKNKNSNS